MIDKQVINLNRRKSIRITDRVLLSYSLVSNDRYQAIVKDFNEGISLYNQEGPAGMQMNIGAQTSLAKLRERDEELANFLNHLDSKINMMLKLVKGERSLFDDLALQKVNLSASGMSFRANKEFALGEVIEFHLVLLPSYVYIYCFGRIATSVPVQQGNEKIGCRIAVEFVLLMDDDREKLIQHNFKQQSLSLRNRRRKI